MNRKIFGALLCGWVAVQAFGAEFDIRDEAEFKKIVPEDAKVEKLAGEFRFTEGPVWIEDGSYLVFSDIPANELKKWTPEGVSTFRKPSQNANGEHGRPTRKTGFC